MVNYMLIGGTVLLALTIPEVRRPALLLGWVPRPDSVTSADTLPTSNDDAPPVPKRNESPVFENGAAALDTNDSFWSGDSSESGEALAPLMLRAGETYESIYFSGCGFLLPFHFGAVAALRDHGVAFDQAVGTSGGVMAALAMLGGADLEVGPAVIQYPRVKCATSCDHPPTCSCSEPHRAGFALICPFLHVRCLALTEKLGIRQCFDLRYEPAAMPWVLQSFFAVFRRYFAAFRSEAFRSALPLKELRGRLFVRLGKPKWAKPTYLLPVAWDVFQVGENQVTLIEIIQPTAVVLKHPFATPLVATTR